MVIQQMFQKDINRPINGVVQVEQGTLDVLVQEIEEYVITKELKKHFITFFNNYGEAFTRKTADTGVWISGFFGSGKSHFLKMLSYILANEEVQGIKTVERFRKKFSDDPATFMMIDNATKGETETILFNIDVESSINKDKTAVLRVFAKMFYNHLGFYGENLKVAKLEQFIAKQGKTEEFHRVFEEKNGGSWLDSRDAFTFFEDDVVDTLQEVLGMSETAARNWFDGTETVETSISQLVSEIKEYTDSKPDNFRLLFMIDEVGQYVGGDTDLLMNLQSLVEKLGSECLGKVWVMCTGQEAIDEIIKARNDEFSRIQARFKTRLSLSSSSADEVIQKRILEKTPEAKSNLEKVYDQNDSVLRNLFSFSDAIMDIKGYGSSEEFSGNFPFVPYQFIMMQKVFSEIRKHGNSGKHLSGGERSMLSGFQEAAQKIKSKDEYAIAPFYLFYDTVHTFLDSTIRKVIERCDRAADAGDGIEKYDVDVLKLLYLIRYVDDIPATIDNIVILMADDIRTDKITMRETIRNSLDRLMSQNYIGRTGEKYNFLTDEEQDIQREIKNTIVDTSSIVEKISQMIFADIFSTAKYRYSGKYDFSFDKAVDTNNVAINGGMCLRFLTVATDANEKGELQLLADSKSNQAIVVLADTPYFELLESAMKIRKYVKQRNVSQLPTSMQNIIRDQQSEANSYETAAMEELKKAIVDAQFYVDGEHLEIRSGDAKGKIDQAMEYLVSHVYSELPLIRKNAENDTDIIEILNGTVQYLDGGDPYCDAAAKVAEFLEIQAAKKLPTSMADIQSRYKAIPYGWKEKDIAAVIASLIVAQKVTIKYAGATVQPDNSKFPVILYLKSEVGKTLISTRMAVSAAKMKEVREFLREYFDVMDIPADEDGLVKYIVEQFSEQKAHYEELDSYYSSYKYPDHSLVQTAITMMKDVLAQQKDNIALIDHLIKKQDTLFDNKEAMENVENFFKSQRSLFDEAVKYEENLRHDIDYLANHEDANNALNRIRLIITVQSGTKYDYKRIPELNTLMAAVKAVHDELLDEKKKDIHSVIRECMAAIHKAAGTDFRVRKNVETADNYYAQRREKADECTSLAILDGFIPSLWQYKDDTVIRIEIALKPAPAPSPAKTVSTAGTSAPAPKKEVIKPVHRQVIFPAKTLKNEEEIETYLNSIREQMLRMLNGCDGLQIK